MNIQYRRAAVEDIQTVTELALRLYGEDNTYESLYDENLDILKSRNQIIFLADDGGKAVGFVNCALRFDYVEGTNGGSIGYLEGIYVLPEYRCKGTAKTFVSLCENWAREKGCKEFASDCLLSNNDSYHFHLKMGFVEANRIICFTKKLY